MATINAAMRSPAPSTIDDGPGPEARAGTGWREWKPVDTNLERGLLVVLFGRHQHLAGLRAVARGDDALFFELVHDASGPREADAQLALEHRRRPDWVRITRSRAWRSTSSSSSLAPPPMPRPPGGHVERDDGLAASALGAPVLDDRGGPPPRRPTATGGGARRCDDAVTSSMSPLPISRSAPAWSRMTRLSASEETAKAMRLGHVGLDDAGDDVDARTLGREHQVDADGARHLGDAHDRLLDVARRHHHQVVELVDDDHDVGELLRALAAPRRRTRGPSPRSMTSADLLAARSGRASSSPRAIICW